MPERDLEWAEARLRVLRDTRTDFTARAVQMVLEELSQLRRVKEAAEALVGHWCTHITSGCDMTEQDLIAALAETLEIELVSPTSDRPREAR